MILSYILATQNTLSSSESNSMPMLGCCRSQFTIVVVPDCGKATTTNCNSMYPKSKSSGIKVDGPRTLMAVPTPIAINERITDVMIVKNIGFVTS